MNTKKRIVFLTLMAVSICAFSSRALAWLPTGWVYHTPNFAYSHSENTWYYLNEPDTQWRVNMSTYTWGQLSEARGWTFYNFPWAYSHDESAWYWYNMGDTQWAANLTSGGWSRLGATGSGDVKVTLTWDTTADLDLYVTEPNGETISYLNRSSSTGGQLDRDDRDGFGPENIFWPTGSAPSGQYSVTVKHFSGALPSTYTVVVVVGGASSEYSGTLTTNREEHFVTEFQY